MSKRNSARVLADKPSGEAPAFGRSRRVTCTVEHTDNDDRIRKRPVVDRIATVESYPKTGPEVFA